MVSNIHALEVDRTPCEARSGILFVGSFQHAPNTLAVRNLLVDILPLMLARMPNGVASDFKVCQSR